MTLAQLMDKVIEDGIKSVNFHETRPEIRRGGVAGFELCKDVVTTEGFESILLERHQKENEMRWSITEDNREDYWEYRTATAQVEWCYDILRAALRMHPLSARAVLKYQSILDGQNEL